MEGELYYLSEEQLEKMKPYFPKSHGKARVCDRKVLSGIIYVLKNGLMWRDAPKEYGSYKTLYNRYYRWSLNGTFERIFKGLASEAVDDFKILMIDSTHLKAHRTACSLQKK